MQLNTFIANYIPTNLRQGRDFVGPRGWVHLTNMLLKRLAQEGLVMVDLNKEVGVETVNDRWITIPSDCRDVLKIYDPEDPDVPLNFEIVNGRIKLDSEFSKKITPDAFTLSTWATTGVKINDADATADLWNEYLLVVTNGDLSGRTFKIWDSAAAGSGVAQLTFELADGSASSTSTAGYLTDMYLMLKYTSKYAAVAAAADEIPIGPEYEDVLINGLCMLSTDLSDKRYATYFQLFKDDLDRLKSELSTPTVEQARPVARSLPGFEECEEYGEDSHKYTGDN